MRVINISRMGQLPDEQNSGILGDIGTDLQMAGGAALQQTAALGDFVARPFRSEGDETFSERLAGKGEDTVGSDAWMARKQAQYSPARQQAERDYQETVDSNESELGKLGATAYGLAANPRALLGRVVQSAPTFAMAAIPGGMVGAGLRAAGAGTRAIATGARLGAAAGEGIQSGTQNAYDAINSNIREGRGRYEGVGGAQAITAIGVGATSLLGGKLGGGIEAGLFNKEVRQGFQKGWKGTGRAALAEGAEEGVQSTFETVPQNIALDRPWNEGLGQNVGEGTIAGAAMGGGFHAILRPGKPESLVQGANKSPEIPQTEQPVEAGQTNVPNNEAQPAPEPMPEPAPVEIPEPTPQQAAVNEAVAETPMAGTQPVPEPVVPQAPQEDPEVTKLREAQAAQETYRQAYGDEPSRAKEISKGELKADSVWRQANPEDVGKLDTLVKANIASGAHKTPKALRDLAYTHHSYQGTELADKFDRLSNEAKNPTEAGFFAAAAELIRHPDADLSHFMQDRAKAATQAMGEQAAQQNAKVEAEAKVEAKEEAKPDPVGVFLNETKPLLKPLQDAGLLDKKLKSVDLPTIESKAFRKKVAGLSDEKARGALEALTAAAKKVKPDFTLEIPDRQKVKEALYAKTDKEAEKTVKAAKAESADLNKKAEENKTLVKEGKRDKPESKAELSGLLAYLDAHPEELSKQPHPDGGMVRAKGALEGDNLKRVVEWLYDPKRRGERKILLHRAKKEVQDAEIKEAQKGQEEETSAAVEAHKDAEEATTETVVGKNESDTPKQAPSASMEGRKGASAMSHLKSAYKAATDGVPTPKSSLKDFQDYIAKVEKPLVDKGGALVKALGNSKSDTYGDALGRLWADYTEYMNDQLQGLPEKLRNEVIQRTPVMQWVTQQYLQSDAGGFEFRALPPWKAWAKNPILQAINIALRHNGDGGWFKMMPLSEIRKAVVAAANSKAKQDLLAKSCYWRSISDEGVMVPFRDVNSEITLQSVVSDECAEGVARAKRAFEKAGLPIPNAFVVDRSRQVIPSREGLRQCQGTRTDLYAGLTYEIDGTALDLADGKSLGQKTRVVVALTYPKGLSNSFKDRTKHYETVSMPVHEMLHALDITAKSNKLPSNTWIEELSKTGQYKLLVVTSRLLSKHDGDVAAVATGLQSEFQSRTVEDFLKWLQAMPIETRAMIAHRFAYPDEVADRMGAAGEKYRGMETMAAFGSAMIDESGAREMLRDYFPEVFTAVDRLLKSLAHYKLGDQARAGYALPLEGETNALRSATDQGRTSATGSVLPQSVQGSNNNSGHVENKSSGEKTGTRKEVTDDLQLTKSEQRGAGTGVQSDGSGVGKVPKTDGDEAARETREARVQQKYDSYKISESVAVATGLDPKVFEMEGWKTVARDLAEKEADKNSADSRVGNATKARMRNPSSAEAKQKLADARAEQVEAKAKYDQAMAAYTAFMVAHTKDVPYTPMKPQKEQQYFYDRLVEHIPNAWLKGKARNIAASLYKHSMGFMFTRDLVNVAKKALPSITKWYNAQLAADQVARRHQDKAVAIGQAYRALDAKQQDLVNDLLDKAVSRGLWFTLPKNASPKVADIYKSQHKDSTLEDELAEFEDLTPEAKQVFKEVLEFGIETRQTVLKATLQQIEDTYNDRVERNPGLKEEYEQDRDQQVALAKERFGETTSPYVPMRRFGTHVVILRSPEYQKAYDDFARVQKAAQGLKEPTKADRKLVRDARAKVLSMQSNGMDYVVEYAESADEAVVRRGQLQQEHPEASVVYKERAAFEHGEQLNLQALLNVAERAAEAATETSVEIVNEKMANKFNEFATLLYIQGLSNDSALKSRLHRRKVAGYSSDMMRGFMATASTESRYLGFLSHGREIRKAMAEMQKEARTSEDQAAASTVLNEVIARVDQSVKGQSALSNSILRGTSAMMLLTNPAFFFQNLTQPILYSVPYMAGRFGLYHPLTLTSKYMVAVAKAVTKDGTLSDLSSIEGLTDKQKEALTAMRERGRLDIGLSQEFGEFNRAEHGKAYNALLGWTEWTAGLARKVEVINRAATALAAYDLEMGRTNDHEGAMKFADHVLYETHGDYSSRNAPRYFKSSDFARVATQFRKFQLIQIGLFARMFNQAIDKESPEKQAFARAGLAYTMGAFLLVTGVKGLPVVGTLMLACGLMGGAGDNDEDYLRQTLKDAGLDKPLIDFFLRGLQAMLGMDMSDKLGAGSMLLPFPYLDGLSVVGMGGEDDGYKVIATILGPAGSLLLKGYRGAGYAWQGDWDKAAENVLPTGFANVAKAIRFGTEGISSKAGDVLIPGEQFTLFDLASQAVGLPSTTVTNRNLKVSSMFAHNEAYTLWAKQIRRAYEKAVADKDSAGRAAAMREWQKMNAERRSQGFKPNAMTNLISSVKQQRQRERMAIGGVAANKSSRGFAKKLDELY